jgi:hypothetical protein
MKEWLTEPDPPESIALQVLQAVGKVLLGLLKVLLFLWPLWI